VPASGEFTLNYFPTELPEPAGRNPLADAFTDAPFADWTYDPASRKFSIPTSESAPSCLKASYEANLGCIDEFPQFYDEDISATVPALTKDSLSTLAGIRIDPAFVSQLQVAIEHMCEGNSWVKVGFCDHRSHGGDFSGLDDIPWWQVEDSTGDHFLFDAMRSGQTGWRRQAQGRWAVPDRAQKGDMIGPWNIEDLQRALALLRWVPFAIYGTHDGELNARCGWGISEDSLDDAKAQALAESNTTSGQLNLARVEVSTTEKGGAYEYSAYWSRSYAYFKTTTAPRFSAPIMIDWYYNGWSLSGPYDAFGDTVMESGDTLKRQMSDWTYNGNGEIKLLVGDKTLTPPAWGAADEGCRGYTDGYEDGSQAWAILKADAAFRWK
jgi:hypothetical protein